MTTTLHLTNAYHPTSGGIRTFYSAMLDAAERERRRVVLVVPGARTGIEDVGEFGRLYYVKAPAAPAFDRRYRLILPHRYMPLFGSSLIGILERERPDVVEICDKYSLPYLAAMLRKNWHPRVPRPALVGLTCERFDDNMAAYLSTTHAARAFTRWYIRNIYGPPFDVHVAISEYTAGELRDALPERDPDFIRVAPLGVDTDAFAPDCARPDVRRDLLSRSGAVHGDVHDDAVMLFYAGRLAPEKNITLLVETLRVLVSRGDVDYRLVIAGDGPLAGWLRQQAVGPLQGRLLLLGNVSREELATLCASCDVFVHPNPREPFGIGPLEAMASGVPVVLPDAGGVLEYATPRNSWMAWPQPEAFATAIAAAHRGDPLRVTRAIETARQFRWDRITDQFFALYDEVAARRHSIGRTGSCVLGCSS